MGFFDFLSNIPIVGDVVGGVVSGGLSMLDNNINRNYNSNMMHEQMRYNTSEREASQAYQTSERTAQQQYQTSEREAQNLWMESMYGKYQSPEAQVRQYNNAGINGRLAVGQGNSLGTMSASSGSNGGAPSSGAPSGRSVSSPYVSVGSMTDGFANIAGALKALGEAKKLGIETKYYEQQLIEDLRGKKLANETTELANSMSKIKLRYLEPNERAELSKKLQDLATGELKQSEISANIRWLKAKGLIAEHEEQYWLNKYNKEMQKMDSEINLLNEKSKTEQTSQGLNIASTADTYSHIDVNKSIVRLNNSLQDLNDAEAYLKRKFGPQVQASIIRLNNANAKLTELNAKIQEATTPEQIESLKQKYKAYFEQYRKEYATQKRMADIRNAPDNIFDVRSWDDLNRYFDREFYELIDIYDHVGKKR